ncbi:4-carboxymuconolactone decarboxylase [Chryseobacterium nakagawai]|uniref:Carboxymuconolactone decarboxylase n=1 Tax=Chryseobacterium nakagawai TaxID=1241982 RepID=A0AAD0YMW6_CHRNA|nr:carboxymuconolactone decarboxylase family protein [Chryseobacterium nakagawai]AZA92797.1 carboxymuconolactone decarboxylase [Chryseobacterium nakagawai]VEH19405.1 4-carboxymuconolactone decarboxylase [Chryseobacterium nakagawai]
MKQLKYFILIIQIISVSLFPTDMKAQQLTTQSNNLSGKDKSTIAISSFTAQGKLEELRASLNNGLDAGLTINEIKEILVHTYAYCGFPRSIRGLQTFMEVLDERKSKGINDTIGKEASTIENDKSKYERGKEILGQLTQTPQSDKLSGYSAFAPIMDTFLKEHLFADIFERDVLTYAQRELVTISVISAIGDAEPMLQSHLGISLNVGWTPQQLNEFVTVVSSTINKEKSNAAKMILNQVLKNRSK